MVDWREGLRRSAAVTGHAYLFLAVALVGVSAYEHGYISQHHFLVKWEGQGKSADVVTIGSDAQTTAVVCEAEGSNRFSKLDPSQKLCAGLNHPRARLQGKWDWGLAGFYGGRLAVYLAIIYAIGWAVFRGLRWAALRCLADAPEWSDHGKSGH